MSAALPWLGTAASGAALGASVSEDKQRGAMKGALIGLGGLASGKLARKITDVALKKMFNNKFADVLKAEEIMKASGNNAAVSFLKSKGYGPQDVKELQTILRRGNPINILAPIGLHAAGTAGVAYALKNGNSPKKQ